MLIEDIEYLCDNLDDNDAIIAAAELFGGENGDAKWDEIAALVTATKTRRGDADALAKEARARKKEALAREAEAEKALKAARAWSEEERSCLAKAATKFPAGAQQRWATIADFINTTLMLKSLRTKDECIEEYKSIQAAPT